MAGERILVVDDNPQNVKLVTYVLEARGFVVNAAANVEEATTSIVQQRPDLVLMDVQLPGTDGLTFTRQLRADPATKDLVVVAFTAYAMRGDDQRAYEAGCDGYLTKPIDTRAFPGQLAEFLKKRR